MIYPQTWLVFALVYLILAGAAVFRGLRLSAISVARRAWAWTISLTLGAIAAIAIYFWSQHTYDENAAFEGAHGLAHTAPLNSSVVGVFALVVLAAVGFLALQLGLYVRFRHHHASQSSRSGDATA